MKQDADPDWQERGRWETIVGKENLSSSKVGRYRYNLAGGGGSFRNAAPHLTSRVMAAQQDLKLLVRHWSDPSRAGLSPG